MFVVCIVSACRWIISWMRPSHPPWSCRSRSTSIKRRTAGSWRSCRSFSRSEDWSWRSICWRRKPCRNRYRGLLAALFSVLATYLSAETDAERDQTHTIISHPRPPMHTANAELLFWLNQVNSLPSTSSALSEISSLWYLLFPTGLTDQTQC